MYTKQGPPKQCSISIKGEPFRILRFESFPESLTEGYSTTYTHSQARVPNKTNAFYGGGDYGTFRLSLDFVAGLHTNLPAPQRVDSVAGETDIDAAYQEMEQKVRWLEALCFPKNPAKRSADDVELGANFGYPPRILLTIGDFLVIEGVMKSVTVVWKPPFHPVSARPGRASVALGIIRVFPRKQGFRDWWDVSGYKYTAPPQVKAAKREVAETEFTRFSKGTFQLLNKATTSLVTSLAR